MVILLGATGFVGGAFLAFLRQRGIPVRPVSRAQMDYTSLASLEQFLRDEAPDLLINCAGYTGKPNVDTCEFNRSECILGNASLPGVIHKVCSQLGIPYGHVSSGCIFTGSHADGAGFREEDVPNFTFRTNNCSFYSGCKALGEEAMGYRIGTLADGRQGWVTQDPAGYVWRLRIPFNHVDSPRNYISKLLSYPRLLDARNSISHLGEFVEACWETWQQRAPFGIYNIVNPGSVSTRDVVKIILDHAASLTEKLNRPLTRESFRYFASEADFMREAAIAPRSNCVLDSTKLEGLGIRLRPVTEAIEDALVHWEPHPRKVAVAS